MAMIFSFRASELLRHPRAVPEPHCGGDVVVSDPPVTEEARMRMKKESDMNFDGNLAIAE